MPVKICDALCGRGKTSSAINLMNSSADRKFIFITQYLTEVERIKTACASRGFISPGYNIKTGLTKLSDIHDLMRRGENIVSTHSLFVHYTEETKKLIEDQKYILILDEVVDVLQETNFSQCDIEILKTSNMIKEENGVIKWINDEYDDVFGKFKDEKRRAQSNNLIRIADSDYSYFWIIPPDLFTSFHDAYVLTYMFQAQPLRCLFDLFNIEYEYIGTKCCDGIYTFCPASEMDRRENLRDKIHILEYDKLNEIGNKRTDLSYTWYMRARSEKDTPDLVRVKNNIQNLFRNIYKAKSYESMWTTFKMAAPFVRGKGYWNGFISYNQRASNEYADKKYLAYCVNLFPRPWEIKFYQMHNVSINSEMYALAFMIQWIFRSAIRRGEEIWIYVPSRRMRVLLSRWLENLAEGKDLEEIIYKTPRRNSFEQTGRRRGRPKKGNKNENNKT